MKRATKTAETFFFLRFLKTGARELGGKTLQHFFKLFPELRSKSILNSIGVLRSGCYSMQGSCMQNASPTPALARGLVKLGLSNFLHQHCLSSFTR
jgi:hypothetical protein